MLDIPLEIYLAVAVAILLEALVVHGAAKLTRVSGASFKKAVLACGASGLASFYLGMMGIDLKVGVLCFLASLVITLFLFRIVYQTGWAKVFLFWILFWLSEVILMFFFLYLALTSYPAF